MDPNQTVTQKAISQSDSVILTRFARRKNPILIPSWLPWMWATRMTISVRIKLFLTGVVFPVVCFLTIWIADASPGLDEPWQSGRTYDYVVVLLSYPAIFAFVPILLFSIICLTIWCVDCETSRWQWMRIGLNAGYFMALVFLVLLTHTTAIISFLFAAIVGFSLSIIVWILDYLIRRATRFSIFHLIIATTIIAIGVAVLPKLFSSTDIPEFFWGALLLIIGGSPVLCFVTFARVSVAANDIYKQAERPATMAALLSVVSGWAAWIAAYGVTWKFAIDQMMTEYATLPTSDPNCYISSAAAFGHKKLVGATRRMDGALINKQMCRIKFIEFAMMAVYPKLHRVIRVIYNQLGPKLARICRSNRLFADATFVMLKPLEWASQILQLIFQFSECRILGIYFSFDSNTR